MNKYKKQTNKFLKETNTEFKIEFLKYDYHFEDDKEKRDIYEITLKRGTREYKFNFGQSLNDSGFKFYSKIKKYSKVAPSNLSNKRKFKNGQCMLSQVMCWFNTNYGGAQLERIESPIKPTAYDILSCLQTYEVGSFKYFCDEFGYSEDSIKAEKTYKAVLNEYNNLKMLYSDEELEKLGEIQ